MLINTDMMSIIKTIPWFLGLSTKSLERLCNIAKITEYVAGDIIFHEGEKHSYLYVLLEGKILLESYVPSQGQMPIFTAESLDVIGWSSLTPVVRQKTSTARVIEPTKLISFDAETLMNLCETDCDLGFIIMRRLANIVASRYLTHRLHLMEKISSQSN
jgi:CRP-like cAMP-binding protein